MNILSSTGGLTVKRRPTITPVLMSRMPKKDVKGQRRHSGRRVSFMKECGHRWIMYTREWQFIGLTKRHRLSSLIVRLSWLPAISRLLPAPTYQPRSRQSARRAIQIHLQAICSETRMFVRLFVQLISEVFIGCSQMGVLVSSATFTRK